jgi:hypothetical protein
MGLPCITLNESNSARWQEVLEAIGCDVQINQEEIKRCEENGEYCEKIGHPQLASIYPYVVSHLDVELRCLEVTQNNNEVSLTFMPSKVRGAKQLLKNIRVVLSK